MHAQLSTWNRKPFFVSVLGVVLLLLNFLCTGSSTVYAQEGGPPPRTLHVVTVTEQDPPPTSRYYSVSTLSLSDGTLIDRHNINGPSVPPPGFEPERQPAPLPKSDDPPEGAIGDGDSPRYVGGCSPTASSAISEMEDRALYSIIVGDFPAGSLPSPTESVIEGPHYPNLYTGPTNGGVFPADNTAWPTWTDIAGGIYSNNPMIASHEGVDGRDTPGTIDNYWVSYESEAQDPYITEGRQPHPPETLADFMYTGQYDLGPGEPDLHNTDGSTLFYTYANSSRPFTCDKAASENLPDGSLGRKLFYESKGYAVGGCYNQPTSNVMAGGFTYAQYKAEINAGRPVMLGLQGHNVVGIGYNPSSTQIYILDGWDYKTHTMTWGGSYSGMSMLMVSMVSPIPVNSGDVTISGYVGVPNATITYTGGSTKASISGYYSFSATPGWSGSVTPSKPGYTFNPPSKNYSNLPDYKTKQNYTAVPISNSNIIQDPSFEAGSPNPFWVEDSIHYDPLCGASCGAGARTGTYWGWFGGVAADETATLSQIVTIPVSSAASLDFYLMMDEPGTGSNTNDTFSVQVDGNAVFSTNATQHNTYSAYTPVSVDLSAYANGAAHTITFRSATTDQVISFHLDDVSLAGTPLSAPGSFNKISPPDGSSNQPTSPTLSWEPSSGASSYEYCYDTSDDDACSPWTSNGAATSKVLNGLNPSTTYYWHVRANNAAGTKYSNNAANAFWSFSTGIDPPGPFNKIAPVNAATVQPTNPTLSWESSSGAASYEYCYDTTNDSACSPWTSTGASTSVGLSGLNYSTPYYWHVRAVNSGGTTYSNGSPAAFWKFTTLTPVVPGTPALLLPPTGSLVNSLRPIFDWKDSVPAAHHYQLQISTNSAFTALVLDEINIPDSTFTPTSDLAPGKLYYWRVRALNVIDQPSKWSTVRTFKTPLAQAVLVSPPDIASLLTDRPAFDWIAVDGATQYNIQVSAVANFSTLLVNATVPASEYTSTKDLPQNKTLYWRVRAKTSVVTGPWSLRWSFLSGNPASAPVLVSPTNNALIKDYTPLLNWNNAKLPPGTTFKHYEIQVDDNNDFSSPAINTTTTPGDIADSDFTPLSDLASNTKFYWRVRAINTVNGQDHTSGWSAVWSFRTVILPPSGLTVIPNGLKPSFDWDDATGPETIKGYTIQISTSANFSTFLINSTTPTSFYTMLKNLPTGKTLYWRVRVNGPNGPSAWTTSQFVTP